MKNEQNLDPIGIILIAVFLLLLTYAGYLSYKSIDWTVLERLEKQQLILPTPITENTPSSNVASPSSTVQK